MKTKVYNLKGEDAGDINLPEEVFGIEMNTDFLHQVVLSQMSNRRQGTAKTKDRSEVSGGGKKPWKQKGTGRARHGSNRSPLWVGGGVTFGPTNEKNYKRIVPKKMRRKAILMVLSEKAKGNLILILDKLEAEKPKTKDFSAGFNKIFSDKKAKRAIVLPGMNKNVILSIRNIKNTGVFQAKDLNALDLLNYKYVVMPKESIDVIKETFAK
ncbi:MAG: 50S ribosomal protein L4 [bacterium]|nr:50S ribosomal protein L4 [bacterium]